MIRREDSTESTKGSQSCRIKTMNNNTSHGNMQYVNLDSVRVNSDGGGIVIMVEY